MAKETKKWDMAKASRVSDVVATIITGIFAREKMNTTEGMVALTAAVGKVIQVTSLVVKADPKEMAKDYVAALQRYFEQGGDDRLTREGVERTMAEAMAMGQKAS